MQQSYVSSNTTLPVRPVGILTVTGARNRTDKRSKHAVWAEVIVTDENGNEFVFDAAAMEHSMKHIQTAQA